MPTVQKSTISGPWQCRRCPCIRIQPFQDHNQCRRCPLCKKNQPFQDHDSAEDAPFVKYEPFQDHNQWKTIRRCPCAKIQTFQDHKKVQNAPIKDIVVLVKIKHVRPPLICNMCPHREIQCYPHSTSLQPLKLRWLSPADHGGGTSRQPHCTVPSSSKS